MGSVVPCSKKSDVKINVIEATSSPARSPTPVTVQLETPSSRRNSSSDDTISVFEDCPSTCPTTPDDDRPASFCSLAWQDTNGLTRSRSTSAISRRRRSTSTTASNGSPPRSPQSPKVVLLPSPWSGSAKQLLKVPIDPKVERLRRNQQLLVDFQPNVAYARKSE